MIKFLFFYSVSPPIKICHVLSPHAPPPPSIIILILITLINTNPQVESQLGKYFDTNKFSANLYI